MDCYCVIAVFGLSTYSQPFIKDSDDQVDMVARITALVCAVLGFIASQINSADANVAFGIVLNLVTIIGGIIIVFYVLSGFKKVQMILQKIQQRIAFTLTRDTMKPLIFSTQLNIERERKFRVWHEFWDTLFRQDVDFRIPEENSAENNTDEQEKKEDDDKYEPKILGYQYGGSPPYLLGFEGTIGERHEENKEIIEHESFESYIEFLKIMVNKDTNDENMELLNSMKYIVENLNGLDVFWDGECVNIHENYSDEVEQAKETENKSLTKFGKMYIIPYPFCAVFLSDDDDNTTGLFSISPVIAGKIFDSDKGKEHVKLLMTKNQDPEIQRRKGVRLKLRALEGSMCHWPIQKYKQKTISRTVRDSEGKSRTETKSVRVLFSFNDGMFGIERDDVKAQWKNINVTRGFGANLHYQDGTGHHNEPGWGEYDWSNEPITIYGEDFGLNHQFEETPVFMRFLGNNYHDDIHEPKRETNYCRFLRNIQNFINNILLLKKKRFYHMLFSDIYTIMIALVKIN